MKILCEPESHVELLDIARAAEKLCTTIYVGDHVKPVFKPTPDVCGMLKELVYAQARPPIIGTMVLNASLADYHGIVGKLPRGLPLDIGVGLGWNKEEFDSLGISFKLADRRAAADRLLGTLGSMHIPRFVGGNGTVALELALQHGCPRNAERPGADTLLARVVTASTAAGLQESIQESAQRWRMSPADVQTRALVGLVPDVLPLLPKNVVLKDPGLITLRGLTAAIPLV